MSRAGARPAGEKGWPLSARPLLALLLLAPCAGATGCTVELWSGALDSKIEAPLNEGAIPAEAPGEPDLLYLTYREEYLDIAGDQTVYLVAALDPAAQDSVVRRRELRPITAAQFERARHRPRWRDVDRDWTSPPARPVSRRRTVAGEALTAVHLGGPWQGRVVYLPQSVPRPPHSRLAGPLTAALLTPACLVGDVIESPWAALRLVYYLTHDE